MPLSGNDVPWLDEFEERMSTCFKVKPQDKPWVIGMSIDYDWPNHRVTYTRNAYINEMLDRFGMSDCKSADPWSRTSTSTPRHGTMHSGIKRGAKSADGLRLVGYADADFASDLLQRRSRGGYVFHLGDYGAYSYKSAAMPTLMQDPEDGVAQSHVDAETMAMALAVKDLTAFTSKCSSWRFLTPTSGYS
eukprot:jgi/Tetstr1/435442/TSEL_024348.t1